MIGGQSQSDCLSFASRYCDYFLVQVVVHYGHDVDGTKKPHVGNGDFLRHSTTDDSEDQNCGLDGTFTIVADDAKVANNSSREYQDRDYCCLQRIVASDVELFLSTAALCDDWGED